MPARPARWLSSVLSGRVSEPESPSDKWVREAAERYHEAIKGGRTLAIHAAYEALREATEAATEVKNDQARVVSAK